ncbi:MAG TPA: ATP-binding protein [Pirellulales bacterium]|jgi:light-regulated signal transduction histidine kinase (bacteriophytochrome)/CheY-like chemotaxis protein
MTETPVDLTNCDREPIHIPGAIQPHGALIVCGAADLTITHVSANAEDVLGSRVEDLLGKRIGHVFPSEERARREASLQQEVRETKPVYLFTVRVRDSKGNFDAIAHRNGESIFVEFEPAQESRELTAPELYRLVQGAIAKLNLAKSVDELHRLVADHVRGISGFDRVMVYRFDEEWNGQVVAESKRGDLEPFLGLHYPASDIPKQARELYTKNWLRFIADRDYVPARILPETSPGAAAPLDMSFSVLRSVSPIHLEYLRNMGVGASMSISLVRGEKLWGLVACHHYAPRFVSYDVRTACELLGQMMSLSLGAAEERELTGYRDSMRRTIAKMTANLERVDDMTKALVDSQPNMLNFVYADGAAVVVDDTVHRLGQTPGDQDILQLAQWLTEDQPGDVFATDNLQRSFGSGLLGSVASGVLSISLGTVRPHRLLWFRSERVRTVEWAGDPAKSVVKSGEDVRLSPRGSFALWKETVRGKSRPWTPMELEAAWHLRDALTRQLLRRAEQLAIVNVDLRLASEEREKLLDSERAARSESERLNRMKDEFVATLSHELRTPLNAILGWAQLLALREGLHEELAEGLDVIERNARSQAQMIEDLLDVSRIISGKLSLNLQDMHLPTIVEAAIQTVSLASSAKGVRIERMIDPLVDVQTTGDPGRLQQVAWNLLSNAVKFTPRDGKIQVVLERVSSHIELSIADTGQGIAPEFLPHIFDRFRQADSSASRAHGGLGLGLSIVRNLVELHGGTVRAHSPGIGLGTTFVVSIPVRAVRRVEPRNSANLRHAPRPIDADTLNLTDVRVLALDDERDARELVKRILEEAGCRVQIAGTIDAAFEAFANATFDVIISDIGMPGQDGFAFIRQLRAAEAAQKRTKTPAVALTAYARAEDRRKAIVAGYQAHIAKPVESGELLAVVASLAGRV